MTIFDRKTWDGQIYSGGWTTSHGGDVAILEPATGEELGRAGVADAEDIAAQVGRRALDELLAAHRLWVEWLDEGRVRKLALVSERAEK